MNLLAVLSIDQAKPLGEMEWYGTVVPLVALQLKDATITDKTTCGELLALILELPADARTSMLRVTVADAAANENALQEVKQDSHRSMLVGLSAWLLIFAFIGLFAFYVYTKIEGSPADQEDLKGLWEIAKEAAQLLKDLNSSP